MKSIKKTMALLLATAFALTGCTMNEQKFITALEKLDEAKYYEQQTHISFELNYSGGDEYFHDEMRSLKPLIDAFAIDYKAVYEGNINSGKLKSHVSAEVNLEPVTLSGEMWFDMDRESDNPKEEIIVKIPALAKAFLNEEIGRDYLYLDYVKYMDTITNVMNGEYISSFSLGSAGTID